MGLSLHVHAHAPARLSRAEVGALVSRWHAVAEKFAAKGHVDHVFETSDDAADLEQFATAWLSVPHPSDPDTATGVAVKPLEGSIFLVNLGKGSEPLVLGLCRYPGEVGAPGGGALLSTGKGDGWHLLSSCKTQYASLHGWEYFRRCHIAVIDLAFAGQTLGINMRIEDESGYWPKRDEVALRAAVERLNRIMAGFAGALKDMDDETDDGRPIVQAPILGYSQFERLEADACADSDAAKIADAVTVIRNELKRGEGDSRAS